VKLKELLILLAVLLTLGLISAGSLYCVSKDYATISCITAGDCFISGTTPTHLVATVILCIILLIAIIITGLWLLGHKQSKY